MNASIWVAVISVIGGILSAAATYLFTQNRDMEVYWQHEKINYYKDFMKSVPELDTDNTRKENFCLSLSTLYAVAPQYVINSVKKFCDELMVPKPNISNDKILLSYKKLILDIRKDIGVFKEDKEDTFEVFIIK